VDLRAADRRRRGGRDQENAACGFDDGGVDRAELEAAERDESGTRRG
jgi:hypothetical protein